MVFSYCSRYVGLQVKKNKSGSVLTKSREGTNGLKNASYPLHERSCVRIANRDGILIGGVKVGQTHDGIVERLAHGRVDLDLAHDEGWRRA